jgi:hypothetical protein
MSLLLSQLTPAADIFGTGVLLSQSASLAGVGISQSSGSGILLCQASDITGAGLSGSSGTGALISALASLDGAGLSASQSTFAVLVCQPAVVVGVGTVTTPGGAGGFWFNYDQKI